MSAARGLPIADAPLLGSGARRARLLRAGLTAALALLVGVAVMLAPRGAGKEIAAASPRGSSTEIVLDVSGSVNDSSYAVAGRTLDRLSRRRIRVGLVVFSDSA